MDAVTYPQEAVVSFISDYLVPLRISIDDDAFYQRFHTFWTPTLAILSHEGHEVQRTIGFYHPVELIASLHLGLAKARLDAGEYDTAEVHLSRLLEQFPQGDVIPEAIFYQGVIGYKMKDDPGKLKQAYETLTADFPDSPWAKRAAPYRLL